jgi:hypothetical protein
MFETAPVGRWVWVSECLPETELRRNEWYNDYLLKAGVDDAVGVRLFESASHTVLFGVIMELTRRRSQRPVLRHFKNCWGRSPRRPACIPSWQAWAGNPRSPS